MSYIRLTVLTLAALLTACSNGVYSTAVTGKGDVLVINTWTGSVRRITDAGISTVKDALPVVDSHTFADTTLATIPITVSGNARYFEGKMLVRLAVNRESSIDLVAWRDYMSVAVPIAKLELHFGDTTGFQLASYDFETSSLTKIVNTDGDVFSYSTQIDVPMTPEAFRAISTMEVQWSLWPEWKPPAKAGVQ